MDAVTPALEHTKLQLFQSFRFGQWVRLAFVGLLAGEMGSCNGFNFNYNVPQSTQQSGRATALFAAQTWPQELLQHRALLVALIVFFVVVTLGLWVLFAYIGSVMRFVLFDSIVSKECHIRSGWSRRKRNGFELFVWQIWFALGSIVILAILVGIPVLCAWQLGWFTQPSEHLVQLVVGGVAEFLVFVGVAVILGVIHVVTKDFVVPRMALEEIDAFEGWRRLLVQLKAEKGKFAGYIGMKIVLAIGAAIVFGIITLIAILLILLPLGGVGLVAVLMGWVHGLTWNATTIALAVIVGCILFAALFFVAMLIAVPTVVFFPAYSIYFFAPRFPPLAALLWPQPPPPGGNPSSPPEAPPLAPVAAPLG